MRRAAQEIKDQVVLEEILKGQVICRLGIMDGDKPYVVPVDYGYEDGCLFIHTAIEGKKLDCLRLNNHVCFEIDELKKTMTDDVPCKWSSMYQSIIGYGDVEFVEGGDAKRHGLDVIMRQHGAEGELDYRDAHVNATEILKVRIMEMTGKRSKVWEE
ncbi:pyridoxamine 5'-phosphate oxidase family protein [Planctomycetota bacterium]|nr:pyridoxamine 5'-phosphate oxidase family protein [Planctomycetota bacterium]